MEFRHSCSFCGWGRVSATSVMLEPSCAHCGCALESSPAARSPGDAPGELGVRQAVRAREVERVGRAGERRPGLTLCLDQELESVALRVCETGDPHGQDLRGGTALADRTYDSQRTDSRRTAGSLRLVGALHRLRLALLTAFLAVVADPDRLDPVLAH